MKLRRFILLGAFILSVQFILSAAQVNDNKYILFFNPALTTQSLFINDFGFSGSLGIIHNKNDFSVCFDIFQSDISINYSKNGLTYDGEKFSALAGGGISWHYRSFYEKKYLFIYPGIIAGFWRVNRINNVDTTRAFGQRNDYIYTNRFTILIAGPTLIAKAGYKHFFITVENTFLIGNDICDLIKIGIEFDDIYNFLKEVGKVGSKVPPIPFPTLPF
jgi:hypothetical protein